MSAERPAAYLLDNEQRTVLEVYSRTHTGLVPDAIQAILASHDGLLGAVELSHAVIDRWLEEVEDADGDDVGFHDLCVRVGARWPDHAYGFRQASEAAERTMRSA